MPRRFKILSVDQDRACILVRYSDGPAQHETEIPLPPDFGPGDSDDKLGDWIATFWPHSQMGAENVGPLIAPKVGLDMDITAKIQPPDGRKDGSPI